MDLSTLIQAARGEVPVDLLLRNARLVNVFSGMIEDTHIAIVGDTVVGLGEYPAKEEIDLRGQYVCPGFLDAHVHLESSMVAPPEFARAVLPRGTTTVIADPHEIANVLGVEGVHYMLAASEGLPLSVFLMAPSCVPATDMETAGAALSAEDLAALMDEPRVIGLAEMMNFPGVLFRVPEVLAKIEAAHQHNLPVDGHAPGLSGRDLAAYIAAGIRSDHECTTAAEAQEKLHLGMYILIREGTTTRDLNALLPMVTPANARRCCFCTDDRHPADLMDEGHVDYLVRTSIRKGLEPVTAIRMATLNTAERFRLWDRGAVAPGYRADLVVFSGFEDFRITRVYAGGKLVAVDGRILPEAVVAPQVSIGGAMHVRMDALDFRIPAQGRQVRVIGVIPGQIVTAHLVEEAKVVDGEAVADVERDILKLAVVERHKGTGNVGLGFIKGIGLKQGALASSVGHDSHNITVVGTNDADMRAAVEEVVQLGGGLVAVAEGEVRGEVPLPIAGLMSDRPLEEVRAEMDALLEAAHELGSPLHDPFMVLGFMALPVIPALKLTDKGLVDVEQFQFVDLFVE